MLRPHKHEFVRFKSRQDAINQFQTIHEGWVQMGRPEWEEWISALSREDRDVLLSVMMEKYHELFITHDG